MRHFRREPSASRRELRRTSFTKRKNPELSNSTNGGSFSNLLNWKKTATGNFIRLKRKKAKRDFSLLMKTTGNSSVITATITRNTPENVVKAMASAKFGYPKVVELFEEELTQRGTLEQTEKDKIFDDLEATLDEQLRAYVVKIDRLTPTIVDVIVKAPLQAKKI